jgi:hypothetical protein
MKLFLDSKARRFVKSAASNVALQTLVLKRRDQVPLDVVFVENGLAIDPVLGTQTTVALKAKFSDSNFLALAAPGTNTLDLFTEPVEAAFSSDPASIPAFLEIRWSAPGQALRTATLQVEVQNSVILGDEATPAAIPDGKATQAEAEAGTDNEKWMTPLRTAQAVQAQVSRPRTLEVRLYEDNALVLGGASPGTLDPSTLRRPGWYFANTVAGSKINWFFHDSTQPGIPSTPAATASAYAVLTPDSLGSSPFIVLYSAPTGTNDAFPGFYHSSWVYQLPTATRNTLVPSQKILLFTANAPAPSIHPELPRHALNFVPAASLGEKSPTELLGFAALHSDSGAQVGTVAWLVESLGIDFPALTTRVRLSIRPLRHAERDDLLNVIVHPNRQNFPPTGRLARLYLDDSDGTLWRWTGTVYQQAPGTIDAGTY